MGCGLYDMAYYSNSNRIVYEIKHHTTSSTKPNYNFKKFGTAIFLRYNAVIGHTVKITRI